MIDDGLGIYCRLQYCVINLVITVRAEHAWLLLLRRAMLAKLSTDTGFNLSSFSASPDAAPLFAVYLHN